MIAYETFQSALRVLHIGIAGIDNFLDGGLDLSDREVVELVTTPYRKLDALGLGIGGQRGDKPDPYADHVVIAATHRLLAVMVDVDRYLGEQSQSLLDGLRLAGQVMADLIAGFKARYPLHADRWENDMGMALVDSAYFRV